MRDLNGMLDASGTGWTVNAARSVSDDNWITGWGTAPNGQIHAVLLQPIPEPSCLIAVPGAIFLLRRRKRHE